MDKQDKNNRGEQVTFGPGDDGRTADAATTPPRPGMAHPDADWVAYAEYQLSLPQEDRDPAGQMWVDKYLAAQENAGEFDLDDLDFDPPSDVGDRAVTSALLFIGIQCACPGVAISDNLRRAAAATDELFEIINGGDDEDD